MASPLEKKVAKSSNSYYCKCCDYITSKKFNWLKHLTTQKNLKKCHIYLFRVFLTHHGLKLFLLKFSILI